MELPLLDMAALDRGQGAAALHEACVGAGFFYVANHGIAAPLIDAALRQARLLFALPLEQRMTVSLAQSRCGRGRRRTSRRASISATSCRRTTRGCAPGISTKSRTSGRRTCPASVRRWRRISAH